MSPNANVPDHLARKLAGICVYPGCPHAAHGDSLYCRPHHDRAKERNRRWAKKRRDAARQKQRCVDCGKKSRTWRCPACWRLTRTARVDKRASRVDKPAKRGHVKLEADSRPGRTVAQRYVGRDRRGAPSKEDTDRDARAELSRGIKVGLDVRDEAIAMLRTEAVAALGAIQRREAHALVADRLIEGARIYITVAEYLCRGRAKELVAELLAVAAEGGDDD